MSYEQGYIMMYKRLTHRIWTGGAAQSSNPESPRGAEPAWPHIEGTGAPKEAVHNLWVPSSFRLPV